MTYRNDWQHQQTPAEEF